MSKSKSGKIRGEKVAYPDGVGYAIWKLYGDEGEDGPNICFDFSDTDLEDMQKVLKELEESEPEVYVEDPEQREREEKWEVKTSTWHYRVLDKLRNVQISIQPFRWGFGLDCMRFTRNDSQTFIMVSGVFRLGPIMIAW